MAGGSFFLLIAAGAALVIQNVLMARITGSMGSVLVALVLNSSIGLVLLTTLLLRKFGPGGLATIAAEFRWWFVLPGLLGSFFVFASITGYQRLGAAPTIALLVASQLLFGLAWDVFKGGTQGLPQALLGSGLLMGGVALLVTR